MGFKGPVLSALLAMHLSHVVVAGPRLEMRDSAVCGSGIYGELAPILKQYPLAEAFCTAAYPVSCTTKQKRAVSTRSAPSLTTSSSSSSTSSSVTTRRSIASTSPTTSATTRAGGSTRSTASSTPTGSSTGTRTTGAGTSRTTSSSSGTTLDPKVSAWSRCKTQPGQVLKTLCSCIQTPQPCKTSSTTSRTTSVSTTASSTTTPSTSSSTTSSSTSSSSSTTSSTSSQSTLTTTSSATCASTGQACFLSTITGTTALTVLDNCCVQGACATGVSPTCNANATPTTLIIGLTTTTSSSTSSITSSSTDIITSITTTTIASSTSSCSLPATTTLDTQYQDPFVLRCNYGYGSTPRNTYSQTTFDDCLVNCANDAACYACDFDNTLLICTTYSQNVGMAKPGFSGGERPPQNLPSPTPALTATNGAQFSEVEGKIWFYANDADLADATAPSDQGSPSLQACINNCGANPLCYFYNYYKGGSSSYPYCIQLRNGSYQLLTSDNWESGQYISGDAAHVSATL